MEGTTVWIGIGAFITELSVLYLITDNFGDEYDDDDGGGCKRS